MTYTNPDQHPANTRRAERLEDAIQSSLYSLDCNDVSDTATDLLTDLLHYCDKYDLEFEEVLRRARSNHEAETVYPEP